MPKLRDKVWVMHNGKKIRGDVTRVVDDTTVDVTMHDEGVEDEGELTHYAIVGGVSNVKLCAGETVAKDGQWWPRTGKWGRGVGHEAGRRKWEGE